MSTMSEHIRRRVAFLLVIVSLAPSVAVASSKDVRFAGAQIETALPAWILRAIITGLIEWGVGTALNRARTRGDLLALTRTARDEARRLQSQSIVDGADRQLLGRVDQRLGEVERWLADYSLREEEVRSLIRVLERDLRDLADRLEQFDARLFRLELEQQRQLRMIIDDQGRTLRLEGQVVDLEGQVVTLGGRVAALEREVFPDPRRFLRHESYLSFELLYASPGEPSKSGEIGVGVNYQYNITKLLGLSGSGFLLPMYAETIVNPDPAPEPGILDLYWTNFAAAGGPVVNVLPAQSAVSLQLGGSLVFMLSYLAATGAGEGFWFSEHWERDTRTIPNFGTHLNARLGFAPPAYQVEGVISAGVIDLFKDLHTVTITSARVRQPQLWYVGAAVRFRNFHR